MDRDKKWHLRYLNLAEHISTWSKDPSSKVGAVAIDSNTGRILSEGYNGFPRGIIDSEERLNNRDIKYGLTIHAELNVVHNSSLSGTSIKKADLYVSGLPTCSTCALSIIQSGISRVIVRKKDIYKSEVWEEEWEHAKNLYDEVNIDVIVIDDDKE